MQFTVIARDDTAPGTLDRRMAHRPEHLEGLFAGKKDGSIIDGGAIIGEDGNMAGSVMLYEAEDRAALDALLAAEVFYREKVWKDIEIIPIRRVPWPE
ncbi:hypothetical protein FDP22_13880 [Paroceanicella profunda]|uniref:YCII-related domain-containing protein n=1 Tax=Paroceanicella profunda TaxID=2579971 RepID=A0A5B8G0V3_9RHOB|nr:YciI family protein [Paroceanicella profunda]QDL92779.1 hypothetical protein FDP22_13880 [Paroceanicella profunda]